jgi:glycosyltransferase involved in cell wall biosynthesis
MAAYNAARTLEQAIRSVLLQTCQDFELIVVDDGSTDETLEIAQRSAVDPRVRVFSQDNGGPSAARNAALAQARGELVSMLDADDLWLPDYLETMGAALDAAPRAPYAYADAWLLHDETRRVRRRSAMSYQRPPATVRDADSFLLMLLARNFVYTSVTARRAALERVGGFDEQLKTGEDWDLWLRMAALGEIPVRVFRLVAIYRYRRDSLTSDRRELIRNACVVYRRYAEDPHQEPAVRRAAERQLESAAQTLRQLESSDFRTQRRAQGAALKKRLLRPWTWHRRLPAPVENTLRAVGELG